MSPRQVVVDLLLAARWVGKGRVPDPVGLIAQVDTAREQVARLPISDREPALAALLDRVSVLDPRRPSRDLLEHLLDGINTCWLVSSKGDEEHGDRDGDGGGAEFVVLVRQRAQRDAGRLSEVPPR